MWPQGLLETAGVTSTVNELIELAGARNCCTVAQEHTVVNKEKLLEWNPDIWLMWYNTDMEPDDIQGLQEFRNTNALRNGHVYELPSPFLCDLWTLKFPYAAGLLASWCYPASFSGFDPEAEKSEMLHFLYGIKKD
jgi:iron complex transport system substrate-binding protein